MILLITTSARGLECAATLKESTGNETHWAENLSQAVARLREQSYLHSCHRSFLLENEPAKATRCVEHLGTASPCTLTSASAAWSDWFARFRLPHCNRRKREENAGSPSVEQQFRSEMCESLTSMLLSCENCMSVPRCRPRRGKNSSQSTTRPRHPPEARRRLTNQFTPSEIHEGADPS